LIKLPDGDHAVILAIEIVINSAIHSISEQKPVPAQHK